MRQIDDHVPRFHLPHPLAALFRQSSLMNSRRRSSNVVIEKMAGRHHPVSRSIQNIKILELAIKRVRPFDRKQSGREVAIEPPSFQVTGEIGRTLNYHEAAARTNRELMQTPRLIERSFRQAGPGC